MSATEVRSDTLLEVRDLRVAYREGGRVIPIVDGVSFQLRRGEALGLAGESGCGKTTTALALLGLLPSGCGARRRDHAELEARRDAAAPAHAEGWRDVRWKTTSMVFQGAMNALDPVMRIDRQIAEAIVLHEPGADTDTRVAELLERVGIPAPAPQYPHEFSGGMRQRVMIALALACGPELIIGDEPTTALDVMTQGQILQLLEELRRDLGLALLLITHDLSVIAETCDRVAVMYAGQIAEQAPVGDILDVAAAPVYRPAARRFLPRRRSARARRGHPRRAAASRARSTPAAASRRAATWPSPTASRDRRRCSSAHTGREARCLLAKP